MPAPQPIRVTRRLECWAVWAIRRDAGRKAYKLPYLIVAQSAAEVFETIDGMGFAFGRDGNLFALRAVPTTVIMSQEEFDELDLGAIDRADVLG